ncbi:MAG: cytidine deaminase [Myxococcota bacterium]
MDERDWQKLRDAALGAREQAYAPYSGFRVGAALRSSDGRVFVGCNVENASYGAAICAERGALTTAIAAGARDFVGLAIATEANHPTMPCGICRQSLSEFAPTLPVRSFTVAGAKASHGLDELLPHAFDRTQLD